MLAAADLQAMQSSLPSRARPAMSSGASQRWSDEASQATNGGWQLPRGMQRPADIPPLLGAHGCASARPTYTWRTHPHASIHGSLHAWASYFAIVPKCLLPSLTLPRALVLSDVERCGLGLSPPRPYSLHTHQSLCCCVCVYAAHTVSANCHSFFLIYT